VALERATGEERWRRPQPSASVVLTRDAAQVLSGDDLTALELTTGEVRWRLDLAALGLAGARCILPLGRRLYGATRDHVFCLRGATA
jgi:hypothetical protein